MFSYWGFYELWASSGQIKFSRGWGYIKKKKCAIFVIYFVLSFSLGANPPPTPFWPRACLRGLQTSTAEIKSSIVGQFCCVITCSFTHYFTTNQCRLFLHWHKNLGFISFVTFKKYQILHESRNPPLKRKVLNDGKSDTPVQYSMQKSCPKPLDLHC